MQNRKLTAIEVDRAHRSGKLVLLGDGDGLYLRKQTSEGASWTRAIATVASNAGSLSATIPT